MSAEGRERFFRSIAERIDTDRVEEVHVFPAIRQGGRESGVAVVTMRQQVAEGAEQSPIVDVGEEAEAVAITAGEIAPEAAVVADGEITTNSAAAPDMEPEPEAVDPSAGYELPEDFMEAPVPAPPPRRFTVLRAHYLLMLKGPDRGKWEVGVVEEAEAPAATVDEVVRGVHERAGGWGAEVPERLTGDDFRAALVEEPWTATR